MHQRSLTPFMHGLQSGPVFDLLVVGDCNPDLLIAGADVVPEFGQREKRVDAADLVVGGSAAIAACGAARLGLRTAFVGAVGDDALGRFMLDALAERGVDAGWSPVEPGASTGITVALVCRDDRAMLTATGAMAALSAGQVDRALLAMSRHVHVASYFLLDGLQPGLPALVAEAHGHGATVSINPQGDPSGAWDSGLPELIPEIDVLFVNEDEDLHIDSRACPCVVVRRGRRGAAGRRRSPPWPRRGACSRDPLRGREPVHRSALRGRAARPGRDPSPGPVRAGARRQGPERGPDGGRARRRGPDGDAPRRARRALDRAGARGRRARRGRGLGGCRDALLALGRGGARGPDRVLRAWARGRCGRLGALRRAGRPARAGGRVDDDLRVAPARRARRRLRPARPARSDGIRQQRGRDRRPAGAREAERRRGFRGYRTAGGRPARRVRRRGGAPRALRRRRDRHPRPRRRRPGDGRRRPPLRHERRRGALPGRIRRRLPGRRGRRARPRPGLGGGPPPRDRRGGGGSRGPRPRPPASGSGGGAGGAGRGGRQPLRPVVASERTNQRWPTTKTTSIGASAITFPAMSSVQLVWWAPWNVARPSCTVLSAGVLITMSGHRKSFHVHRNVTIASVASAGIERGTTIRTRTPSREQPSIRAASSSSIGRGRKNCRRREVPNGVTRLGTISAPRESISPRCCTIRNVGIMTTWNGTISVASIATKRRALPKNRIRAKAYPARLQ